MCGIITGRGIGSTMEFDGNFGNIDEDAILAVRAQHENDKINEKQDTDNITLATPELVELKRDISQGMEKMFKMMDHLKGEIEKIKLNNPPTSLTSPDN